MLSVDFNIVSRQLASVFEALVPPKIMHCDYAYGFSALRPGTGGFSLRDA